MYQKYALSPDSRGWLYRFMPLTFGKGRCIHRQKVIQGLEGNLLDSGEYTQYSFPFNHSDLQALRSHVHPFFAIINAGEKLKRHFDRFSKYPEHFTKEMIDSARKVRLIYRSWKVDPPSWFEKTGLNQENDLTGDPRDLLPRYVYSDDSDSDYEGDSDTQSSPTVAAIGRKSKSVGGTSDKRGQSNNALPWIPPPDFQKLSLDPPEGSSLKFPLPPNERPLALKNVKTLKARSYQGTPSPSLNSYNMQAMSPPTMPSFPAAAKFRSLLSLNLRQPRGEEISSSVGQELASSSAYRGITGQSAFNGETKDSSISQAYSTGRSETNKPPKKKQKTDSSSSVSQDDSGKSSKPRDMSGTLYTGWGVASSSSSTHSERASDEPTMSNMKAPQSHPSTVVTATLGVFGSTTSLLPAPQGASPLVTTAALGPGPTTASTTNPVGTSQGAVAPSSFYGTKPKPNPSRKR